MKKSDKAIWFGCADCSYIPPIDKKQSNDNWKVYAPGKCPKCGKDLIFNIGKEPKELRP